MAAIPARRRWSLRRGTAMCPPAAVATPAAAGGRLPELAATRPDGERLGPDALQPAALQRAGRRLAQHLRLRCRRARLRQRGAALFLQPVGDAGLRPAGDRGRGAQCDTTLLVNTPTTQWYFDDDSRGNLQPLLNIPSSASLNGRLDLWVGTYGGAPARRRWSWRPGTGDRCPAAAAVGARTFHAPRCPAFWGRARFSYIYRTQIEREDSGTFSGRGSFSWHLQPSRCRLGRLRATQVAHYTYNLVTG